MKNLLLSAIVAASLYGSNIDMVQGWNLVGFNSDVNISNSELVTGDVNTVWKYANQDWQLHTNMDIDTNIEIMTTIGRSEGVWVNAVNDFTFEQSTEQNIESHTVNLTTGWNLVSTPFAMDINASEYFTAENVNTVWKYANQDWALYSNMDIETSIASFETINANQGYWVNAKNDFSVTFINPNYTVVGNDNEDSDVENPVIENNTTEDTLVDDINETTASNNTEETTTNIVIKYYIDNNNSVWLEKTTKGFIVKYDIETYENEEYLLVNSFYNDIDLANNAFGSDGFEIDTTALNGDETIEFKIATESMVIFNGTLDLSNYQAVEDNPVLENPVVENNTTEETMVDDVNETEESNTTLEIVVEDNTTEEEVTTIPTFVLAKNIDTNDTDGDGMTDTAELKYGFDPYDVSSFPNTDPEVIVETPNEKLPLEINGFDGAYVIEAINGLIIGMDTSILGENESATIRITHGEEVLKYASFSDDTEIRYDEYNLVGSETLTVELGTYSYDTQEYTDFDPIQLNLSNYSLKVLEAGASENRISYTFKDFDAENETTYREFLRKVWPIMEDRLGTPSENFNCVIENMGPNSPFFGIRQQGRLFLSTQEFIPRLIVHEFVHAWKGRFTMVADEEWNFTPELSGFEEATAEGMAYEIMQDYAKAYPNDNTTQEILENRGWAYNDSKSSHYDLYRTQRNTSSGDFWSASLAGIENRYSAAGTTMQIIVKEYPNFYKDVMNRIHEEINNDSAWRPTRETVMAIWTEVAPTVLGIDTETYLNALPVFDGNTKADDAYIFTSIKHYGNGHGEFELGLTYSLNGNEWWNLDADDLNETNIPEGINYVIYDGHVYSDQQGQDFTVEVSTNNEVVNTITGVTDAEYSENGRPLGIGYTSPAELQQTQFELGFYALDITFDNLTQFEGASERFYFFGYKNGVQDVVNTTLMVGLDIDADNLSTTVEIEGVSKTVEVNNSLGLFDMPEIEPGYEGTLNITVSNGDQSCTYKRALLDTASVWNKPEMGYVIIDTDFNCVEDIYEN